MFKTFKYLWKETKSSWTICFQLWTWKNGNPLLPSSRLHACSAPCFLLMQTHDACSAVFYITRYLIVLYDPGVYVHIFQSLELRFNSKEVTFQMMLFNKLKLLNKVQVTKRYGRLHDLPFGDGNAYLSDQYSRKLGTSPNTIDFRHILYVALSAKSILPSDQ